MILLRNRTSSSLLGAVVLSGFAAVAAQTVAAEAGEDSQGRCQVYGAGFIDMGNGTCGRIGGHVRVQLGTRNAAQNSWSGAGTSNAAMRSYDYGMLPGAGASEHLRVRNGLDTLSPFR